MKPRIIAHRGYSRKFPENTLQAFSAALRAGADALEADLQVSRDGVVLLRHGYLSPCGRPLCELTWSEIKEKMPETPPLEDFLESFGSCDLEVLLEIKDRKVLPGLVRIIDRFPSEVKSRIIVGSFDAPLLRDLKAHLPYLRTSLQLGTVFNPEEMIELARKFLCQFVHPCWESRAYYPHELLPAETVTALHRAGYRVIVWHEERPEFLRALLKLPVYGICTDDPLLLKKLRDHEA